jgi:hypothetical protein
MSANPELSEVMDAAQQLFEGVADEWRGDPKGRDVYVAAVLLCWPWLRPNRYQPKKAAAKSKA